jgi:hypothetical protein
VFDRPMREPYMASRIEAPCVAGIPTGVQPGTGNDVCRLEMFGTAAAFAGTTGTDELGEQVVRFAFSAFGSDGHVNLARSSTNPTAVEYNETPYQ